jgi:heptosyltransferase II
VSHSPLQPGQAPTGSAPVAKPPRIVVYLPSWLGDTVMATPALALIRECLPRSVIVALGRAGADELLRGLDDLVDEVIIADNRSTLGPAKLAGRLRPMKLDAALLLPNSFSSAMTIRLAGIPIRVGYDRDARGTMLTHKLHPALRTKERWAKPGGYAPVSAVNYYFDAAKALIDALGVTLLGDPEIKLTLATTRGEESIADQVLSKGGIAHGERFALLNPGGNNPAKRWPVERFAGVAHHLIEQHGMKVAINGSPAEKELVATIKTAITLNHPEDESQIACLAELGGTVGSLKATVRRSAIMVTNDTGPRHIAAAFGVPTVSLFGPTDPRWTTLPVSYRAAGVPREIVLVADPTLPADHVADDEPARCRIDRISTESVIEAVDHVLG